MSGKVDPLEVFHPSAPNPPDVKAEPDDVKGLRLLANFREFAASEHHLTGIEIDGCKIMLVKFNPECHVFQLDPEVTA